MKVADKVMHVRKSMKMETEFASKTMFNQK